ncbi:MAG: aminomethyl-transferring glycine dehydrogenase [Acidobacteria bacterium]|nr:aminomethyl-transferring glycine dehydrogenase [Acidobacteriota bacterium]
MPVSRVDRFADRHIGPQPDDIEAMVAAVGAMSLDALIDEVVPSDIRLDTPLDVPGPETEAEFLARMRRVGQRNRPGRALIGLGYYGCITPSVILRNVFENPGWYTPYTPYQAEVAQGRLEALLNFQTTVVDLTGMAIANASLLDEATAAAEAMAMMHRLQARTAHGANRLLVARGCFPQTIAVVTGRAAPLGIEIEVGDLAAMTVDDRVFGVLLQYPAEDGAVIPIGELIDRAHAGGALVAVCSDLLALTLLTPPGELGADVVVGNSQRFGVPMGYGGPHAAFFATREAFIRQTPGRIIGVSIDRHGHPAYRMSLQTREQHIRRERATSNICTAQALLANMAGFYAVYHGADGLRGIARRVHGLTRRLAEGLHALGVQPAHAHVFDTLRLRLSPAVVDRLRKDATAAGLHFRYVDDAAVGIALDETTTGADVAEILSVFAGAMDRPVPTVDTAAPEATPDWPDALIRRSPFLTHPVFDRHRSETQMMRYLKRLERQDIGLDTSMIPLGSCTMKLTAASQIRPVTWPEFADLHPFASVALAEGYQELFRELEASLCAITGLSAVSLQPNSGAQGEFAGLMVIRAHQRDHGEGRRDVVLIPASAHGTNPASAAMAGTRVVIVACDDQGNVDVGDLRAKAETHRDALCALMVTYPSTHGVFEDAIHEICDVVHLHGGQVYMDGANMNAQVGVTSAASIGADVCHINLHKTFAIPHGGGGPGMGPIAVAAHLAPYLPGHPIVRVGGARAIPAIAAAPWGSASILLISHGYMRMLGGDGMRLATEVAMLSANYLKARLESHYDVLYTRANGRVAHELIFDLRAFKPLGITEIDVAKRLMDYGFHAPTVSFPVPGTMMVEPTESEPLDELDRFCEALIAIRGEIQAVIDGTADPADNVLKNAPHTAAEATADTWSHPYSRQQAVYPRPFVRANKFWPAVGRINDAHGDRHLICSCPPVEAYQD